MIRCPFNNFSKCDGSCPFSMPNFTACGLADDMGSLVGKAAGALAKLERANEDAERILSVLAGIREAVEDMATAPAPAPAPAGPGPKKLFKPEEPYLRFGQDGKGGETAVLIFPGEHAETLTGALGEQVDVLIRGKERRLLLFSGTARQVSRNATTRAVSISLTSGRDQLRDAFGAHRYVFLGMRVTDDFVELTPTGETIDA